MQQAERTGPLAALGGSAPTSYRGLSVASRFEPSGPVLDAGGVVGQSFEQENRGLKSLRKSGLQIPLELRAKTVATQQKPAIR